MLAHGKDEGTEKQRKANSGTEETKSQDVVKAWEVNGLFVFCCLSSFYNSYGLVQLVEVR